MQVMCKSVNILVFWSCPLWPLKTRGLRADQYQPRYQVLHVHVSLTRPVLYCHNWPFVYETYCPNRAPWIEEAPALMWYLGRPVVLLYSSAAEGKDNTHTHIDNVIDLQIIKLPCTYNNSLILDRLHRIAWCLHTCSFAFLRTFWC